MTTRAINHGNAYLLPVSTKWLLLMRRKAKAPLAISKQHHWGVRWYDRRLCEKLPRTLIIFPLTSTTAYFLGRGCDRKAIHRPRNNSVCVERGGWGVYWDSHGE